MSTGNTPNKRVDLSKLAIEPLDSKMNRAAFCCGNTKIDNFFRNNARDHHERRKVRVYVALYEGAVVGYYYLVAQSLPPDKVSEEAIKKFGRVAATPCVYLGMIGTQEELQDNGIGKSLMVHAMRRTLEVADLIGIYALTLEAIDQKTADKYRKWGFQYFIDGELAMFLPLSTIRELLPAATAAPVTSEIGPVAAAPEPASEAPSHEQRAAHG